MAYVLQSFLLTKTYNSFTASCSTINLIINAIKVAHEGVYYCWQCSTVYRVHVNVNGRLWWSFDYYDISLWEILNIFAESFIRYDSWPIFSNENAKNKFIHVEINKLSTHSEDIHTPIGKVFHLHNLQKICWNLFNKLSIYVFICLF